MSFTSVLELVDFDGVVSFHSRCGSLRVYRRTRVCFLFGVYFGGSTYRGGVLVSISASVKVHVCYSACTASRLEAFKNALS